MDTEQNKEGVSLAQCSATKPSFTKFKRKNKGKIAAKAALSLSQNPSKRELQVPLLLGGQASVLRVRFLSEAALLAAR